jgi:3-methyladenine DNA glycosylase AlkD
MIDDPAAVTARQIDEWTAGFNSWDVCDQVCGNLFNKTHLAIDKAIQFSSATEEYIKRAGFVLMATYAVHNKGAADVVFSPFLHCIAREATDDRNFVKKAVNWALRQIGKRNMVLHAQAVQTALAVQKKINSPAARWIAADALRELQQEKTIRRVGQKISPLRVPVKGSVDESTIKIILP